MSRVLGVALVACALTAGTSASMMQFSVNGVPVDRFEPIEVTDKGETWLTVGVYATPDAPIESYVVEFFCGGALGWTPQWVPSDPVAPFPWDPALTTAEWVSEVLVFRVAGSVYAGEVFTGPGVVAEFDFWIPWLPASSIVTLEYDYVELVGPGFYDDMPEWEPLIVHVNEHVTPEPATLGLLALGALAVIRRGRQTGLQARRRA